LAMAKLRRLRGALDRFRGEPSSVDERLEADVVRPPSIFLLKTPPWDTRLPPLGVGYLSSYLQQHGVDAPIWDCNIDTYLRFRMDQAALWDMDAAVFWFTPEKVAEVFNHECDKVARRIIEADTPYVGFSLTMEGIQFAKLVTDRLRRDAPDKIVVMGGPGVAFPEFRDLFPRGAVDLFVVGAGEEALRLVIEHQITPTGAKRGTPPAGLRIWRDRPNDPDCPLCVSHDVTPEAVVHPTFEGYDLAKYSGRDHLALTMGRGCFRSCAFCSDKPDQGSYRSFGFETLMQAIAFYKERYWIGGITWNDLILNGDLNHLDRYCDVLLENNVELVWDGQATAHRVMNKRPWLFDKMARAGCTDMTFGLESFDNDVLAIMRKGYTDDIAVETLRLTRAAGMTTGINMICGFPGETEAQFQLTLDRLEEHREHIDRVTSLSVCAVVPGSPLWNEAEKFGISRPKPGHYHEWQADDGSNTLSMRLDRHARMKAKVAELGLSAVVQATDEFDPTVRR
jgi:anaerobic magnesium-protoporphyrin IX monomethyl ester cyclase